MKDTIKRMEKQAMDYMKIFANYIQVEDLHLEYIMNTLPKMIN